MNKKYFQKINKKYSAKVEQIYFNIKKNKYF